MPRQIILIFLSNKFLTNMKLFSVPKARFLNIVIKKSLTFSRLFQWKFISSHRNENSIASLRKCHVIRLNIFFSRKFCGWKDARMFSIRENSIFVYFFFLQKDTVDLINHLGFNCKNFCSYWRNPVLFSEKQVSTDAVAHHSQRFS